VKPFFSPWLWAVDELPEIPALRQQYAFEVGVFCDRK
jgi:hypothetical protein